MRSLHSAAALLRAASSLDALSPILSALGFPDPPLRLDAADRSALGAPPKTDARVAHGPGALRALLIAIDQDRPIRDTVASISAHLSRRTPHLLWLIAAVEHNGPHLIIAACDP
ncbi:MAG TPA: hypothetical protein VNW46_19765, partial [Gemmatimonadaceae bacterium]|nr:hypothetical protein [Gemmatimonadaceae bacterium]